MNYQVKITGSGTREEIINSLKTLIISLETCDEPINSRVTETFEDEILFTELNEEDK